MHARPPPLHPVIEISPFPNLGIDFITCQPLSTTNHHYIIVDVNYFTKWAKAMPTYSNNVEIVAQFIFNHFITRFGIPKSIVTDHGSHFCNNIMTKIATLLKFHFLRKLVSILPPR